jgi:cobalamin biosynthesis Mg chelatase CobN
VPLSVFALLAFACFPVFALAEDSSGIQYSDAPPTVTGKKTSEPPARASETGGGTGSAGKSATGPGSSRDNSSDGDSSSDETGGVGAGKGGGSGKGNPNGSAADAGGKVGKGSPAPGSTLIAEDSADGGSSPLVPILIALAVLAAVSIGVVAAKRRRQDPGAGSSVSPEAS